MADSIVSSLAVYSRTGTDGLDELRKTVEDLYVLRHSLIFRYMIAFSRNATDAEDLTQEAFLRLFDHCASGHEVANVVNWLMVVARNLAIDRARGRQFEVAKRSPFWLQLLQSYADHRANAEQEAIAKDRQEELERVLSCLTSLERECLTLRSEGLQYRQIAERLRISLWSAAHHTTQAIRKLKQRVGGARTS